MEMALALIQQYSERGIPMMTTDRVWQCCHSIFAVFIGNHPEQALVTCTYQGHCPKCQVSHNQTGEYREFLLYIHIHTDTVDIYRLADDNVYKFHKTYKGAGIKPVYHPFWQSLLFANVFQSITPDILYQLLQGIK